LGGEVEIEGNVLVRVQAERNGNDEADICSAGRAYSVCQTRSPCGARQQ